MGLMVRGPAEMSPEECAQAVVEALTEAADPDKAEPMRAYMKSAMPYLGVQKPERVRALKGIWAQVSVSGPGELQDHVAAIWDHARHREIRYAALDLLDLPRHRKLHDLELLPLLSRLVTEGAWWDLVDACSRPIGHLLLRSPEEMKVVLRTWAVGSDLWLRRSALIAQLRLRDKLDFPLLEALIDAALSTPGLESDLERKDQRFFLRKAAGWALRTHARTDPEAVRAYLARHPELPSLTRREAAKHL